MRNCYRQLTRALNSTVGAWKPNVARYAALATLLVAQGVGLSQTVPARTIATRYVTALQQRDYKTIVELYRNIWIGEAGIRVDNPKSLWPELIAEYRERWVRELKGEEKPSDIGDELYVKSIQQEIDEQLSFFQPECKWAIDEIRPDSDLAGHRFSTVFVTVTYATRARLSRNAAGKPTILKFIVMAPENKMMYEKRVEAGGVLGVQDDMIGTVSAAVPPPSPVPPPSLEEIHAPVSPPPAVSLSNGNAYSGPTTYPKLISKVEPEYSEEARKAKHQGTVMLNVVIGDDGVLSEIKVVKSLGLGLDEKAIECVKKWRFEPGTRGGKPVKVEATLEVNFRLLSTCGSGTTQRIRVGGGVQAAMLVSRSEPLLPVEARASRISGVVKLAAVIGCDGTVQDVTVIGGPPVFVPAVVEAVRKWMYKPTLLNGEPVEVATQIEVAVPNK
jgi:TonB family protein